ncbi:unnamed protein product [Prunus armeniaca]
MEFRPPVGLLIPGRGFMFEKPAYQPTIPRLDCLPRKWARHRCDVGTKTGSALVSGEIPGRVLSLASETTIKAWPHTRVEAPAARFTP